LIGSIVASSWISRVLASSVINPAFFSLIEPFFLCYLAAGNISVGFTPGRATGDSAAWSSGNYVAYTVAFTFAAGAANVPLEWLPESALSEPCTPVQSNLNAYATLSNIPRSRPKN
jgi:hypothetical protein